MQGPLHHPLCFSNAGSAQRTTVVARRAIRAVSAVLAVPSPVTAVATPVWRRVWIVSAQRDGYEASITLNTIYTCVLSSLEMKWKFLVWYSGDSRIFSIFYICVYLHIGFALFFLLRRDMRDTKLYIL